MKINELPKFWCIKARTSEEALFLHNFIKFSFKQNNVVYEIAWKLRDMYHYYFQFERTNFINASVSYNAIYTEVSFDDIKNFYDKVTYKYTPEYCKNENNNVAILVKTSEEVRLCDQILNNNNAHYYLFTLFSESLNKHCISAKNNNHSSFQYYKSIGYEIIKAKDFIENNKHRINMNKKIIGYRLKEECGEYEGTASHIAFGNTYNKFEISRTGCNFDIDSPTYAKLKKAGVLDIWFQPVYEQQNKVFKLNNGKEVIVNIDKKTISIGTDNVIFPEFITWYKEFILPIISTKYRPLSKWKCSDLSMSIGCVKNIKIDEIKEVYDYIYNLI